MRKSDNKTNIEIIIEIEGVYAQGFGMIAQAVMFDKDLPLPSKTIYAYLASYAGSGKIFPKRDTILKDLDMNKDTYYKYLQPLIDNGYIVISKAKGFINKNVYTICNNPKKVNCNAITSDSESTLSMNGIYSKGYGNAPKLIMCDTRLSVKSRGLIAFFYSLAQAGTTVFPSREVTRTFLGISKQTYYNCLNQLIEYGYITVIKRTGKNGRFAVNNYILNTNPVSKDIKTKEKSKPCIVSSDIKENVKSTDVPPCPIFSDIDESVINTELSPCPNSSDNSTNDRVLKFGTIPCPKTSDNTVSQNFGQHNNTIYNSTIYNINSYQSNSLRENVSSVPFTEDNDMIIDSIHILTQYNNYVKLANEQNQDARLYCKAVEALCEMATCRSSQTFNKRTTTHHAFISALNDCVCDDIDFYEQDCSSLRDLIFNSIYCYDIAIDKFNVRNKTNYLKAIIFDNIINFNL